MRVQLLNPPVSYYQGIYYRMNAPLGLPIICAVLRAAGHECEVADLEALGYSPDRLRAKFEETRNAWPEVVGLTCLTQQKRGVQECIGAIRAAGFTGKIAVGGPHATLLPDEPLSWGADLVVRGECEGNVVSLLTSDARGVHVGAPMPIADLPAPAWPFFRPLVNTYGGNVPFLGLPECITMWSRGCPHNCLFCGNAVFGHQRTRYRPPENIATEIEGLRVYQPKSLFVYDDELVGQRQPEGWMGDIADRIGDTGLVWKCQGRCSRKYITEPLLRDAYRAGCRLVFWGVESFSQRTLNNIRKGTTVEDNWHTLRTAKQAGLKNLVLSMVGNYGEGDAELEETTAAFREAYREGLVDYRQTTVVTTLPGTELYKRAVAEGWYTPPPEYGPQMAQAYQSTPWLTAERIAYWVKRIEEACPVAYG